MHTLYLCDTILLNNIALISRTQTTWQRAKACPKLYGYIMLKPKSNVI